MAAVAGLLEANQEPRPPGLRRVRTASELPKGKLGLASLALPTRLLVVLIFDPIDLAQCFRPACVAEVTGLHHR
jgi:hypothetical protein